MKHDKLLLFTFIVFLFFPFEINEVEAASTNLSFEGLAEISIGQWEPWPLDYKFQIYAIPSLEGSNYVSWSIDRDTISPGESLNLRIELQEGTYNLRMSFRIVIVKKSTNQVLVDKIIGGNLPSFSVPGFLSTPKFAVPVFPLEEFGIPAELSVYFRLNLDTSLTTSLTVTGLNPYIVNENFQSSGTKSITFSKSSGVGANIDLKSTSISAEGSIIVSLGLSIVGFPTPFTVDFASVSIADWILSDYQQVNLASLKTPVTIDFSTSQSVVNLGDIIAINGYITPPAQNIPLQLLVDGFGISSTQTRGDGYYSLSFQPNSPGTYTISVKALESTYTTSSTSTSRTITVNKPPEASFRFSPINPRVTENIQFTDESYDSDGQIVNWNWNFGDGSTSYSSNPTHTYSQSGSYTARLTVTDNNGASNTYTKTISVTKISTSIYLRISHNQIYMGESVRLSGSIDTIVSGAQLTLILREPDGTTFERIVSSRSDGTYELAFTPTETGTWRVQSSWDGDYAHLGSSSSSLTFNVITSSGSLTIVIKDEKGNAVSGAAVSSTSQPSGQTSCSSMSDTEGTVTFPDLKPGSYSFKVSCSGYEDQTLTTNIVVGEMVNVVIPLSKKLIQMPSQPTVPSPTPSESRSEAAGKSNIQTGIPGFPIVSILLGLSIAVLIMIIRKSR